MESPNQTLERIRAELPGYGFTDYLRQLPSAEAAATAGKPLRIALLRSYTVEPIEPVMKLRLILDGFRPTFWVGGYNQYVQEIVDRDSHLHRFQPDLIVLMTRLEEVMPDFIDDFASRSAAEWQESIASKVRDIGALMEQIANAFPAQVIVQNMTPPRSPFFGVHDSQHPGGQGYMVQEFNRALATALTERSSAFVWDFDQFARTYGYNQLHDPKAWYVSRNPFRQAAYPSIGDDLMRHVRSVLGGVKKCIVLDLDNTLWGGLAGEDGIEGIRLGHSYPGNCYREFQKELLKLFHRGFLLAINSKNNQDDALAIIDNHPDMILRRHHFAAMRINWRDKAANLRDLARELNIGVDSCVFVDDSPVECELVRRECPEADVVLLPEKPYLVPDVPRMMTGIENIRLTAEDRRKGAMYQARAARQDQQAGYSNLNEFLASLEIEVSIDAAVPFSIPRIAQLTQKTNQFNVTTRRYSEAEIQALIDTPGCEVFSVSSRDRFGDDGIIGMFILRFVDDDSRIDTLLLSCRVIGRGIEDVMIAFIVDTSRKRGARQLVGEFLPTPKNQPAAGLYERLGFQKGADALFRLDLRRAAASYPSHIRNGREAAVTGR